MVWETPEHHLSREIHLARLQPDQGASLRLDQFTRFAFLNLVDLERFELSTSSMPWKRAPNCATGPNRTKPTSCGGRHRPQIKNQIFENGLASPFRFRTHVNYAAGP